MIIIGAMHFSHPQNFIAHWALIYAKKLIFMIWKDSRSYRPCQENIVLFKIYEKNFPNDEGVQGVDLSKITLEISAVCKIKGKIN